VAQGADTIGQVSLSFPLRVSLISACIAIVLTICFWFLSSSPKETLIFFAASCAAAGQVTASFYTARMLSETIKQNEQTAQREDNHCVEQRSLRQRRTLAINTLRGSLRLALEPDITIRRCRDTARELVVHCRTDDDLLTLVDKKSTNVIHILNFLEEIGTCHRLGLCEEDLIQDQFDAILVSIWSCLLPWIVQHRKQRKNDGIWQDVERLAKLWRK
jgi:Domain of unknown function (DUF4760)